MRPDRHAPSDAPPGPASNDAPARRSPRPAALGMLAGTIVGSGLATLLYAFTHEPLWFTVVGMGTAVGLVIGAAAETQRRGTPRS